ncbi:MAG: DNA repair protein RecN [Desulfobacteraceae bacterium 4572_130]|nr:MAG: DNA repair protein RecN [Desulfobacteraceae bacterium 4572_130]
MLKELTIKNFAIIEDIRISFAQGLSVLTGETGTGKSIIIEAVNLLLGSRASADLVRTGKNSAELEALFEVRPDSNSANIMEQQDFDPQEGLMIRRIISAQRKHKIFINSRLASMQLLKLITKNLAEISSQHAHQGLLKEENHLDILDKFAGTYALRNQIKKMFNDLVSLKKEILNSQKESSKNRQEKEFLKFQIKKIENAKILENEDKELEIQKNRLKNGAQIFETVNNTIEEIYTRDNSIIEKLGIIKVDFEKHAVIDPILGQKSEKISQILFELEDIVEDLRLYIANIELDPKILEKTEQRFDLIQKLKREYNGDLENLFIKYKEMKKSLLLKENINQTIKDLEKKAEFLLIKLYEKAKVLSKKRIKAGKNLIILAENELKELEMEQTIFKISINQIKADVKNYDIASLHGIKIFETGIDKVVFLMASSKGEELKPLNRIASGGELSRVVLALKAILSETQSLGTLIFDEVDAGIGGKISEKVGKKLKKLALKYQVICITHLAQIAKYGSSHFNISKSVLKGRTFTFITPLKEKNQRIKEIARMIGGEKITNTTLNHAREMLEKVMLS